MFSFEGFAAIDRFLRSIYRVAFLNLLWTVTTVLGLGVFGFGPASYALAKYIDRWVRHDETPPPLRTFVGYLREQTWPAMRAGWILLGAGAVIITNIFWVQSWAVQLINLGALVVLGIAGAYLFPVMAATEVRTIRRQFASALLIGFGSLHWTILGATAVGLTGWLLWRFAFPVLVLFGVGIPAYAVGLVTRIVFRSLVADASQPVTTVQEPSTRL